MKQTLRAGITLLELVLVMMILGVMVGGGLGFFASLDLGRRQAVGLVETTLRTTRNAALASRSVALVRVDPEGDRLTSMSLATVGTWRFEGKRVGGALGLDGSVHGEPQFLPGFLGDALHFTGAPRQMVEIPVNRDPAYDPREGFSIQCMLRLDRGGGGKLIQLSDAIHVLVNATGAVKVHFVSWIEGKGRGGKVVLQTPPGTLLPELWSRLSVDYDRRRFSISVDGVIVASNPETAPVAPLTDGLLLSDSVHPFQGTIDDLVIRMMFAEDPVRLPPGVTVSSDSPREIRFDPGGGLDREVHPGMALLNLDFDDGTRESVAVGVFGTVD